MTEQQIRLNLEELSNKVNKLQLEVTELKQKIQKPVLDVPEFMRGASIIKR